MVTRTSPKPPSRMEATSRANPMGWLRSEKIRAEHWERLAIVYIRQSTPQQVLQHQESTRLQYSLRNRAEDLGWRTDRVLTIDDDLGISATTAEGRLGFQHLVSEVTLGHVGIILGVEMSRLARSNKDWHQLLEACALFGTLIADLDGIYNPIDYNDRLLLGLKGTMSEAELHLIKQRMRAGKLQKAKRGELGMPLPTGYVHRSSGEIALDPDEQVQEVVRLIFRKFSELGTLNALLQYLVRNRIQLGIRLRSGPRKGELEWRRPNRMTLQNLLKHPSYAGAYVYGRRQIEARCKKPGRNSTGRVVMDPSQWHVLLKDRLPAYISWEQYEANLNRLKSNRAVAEEVGAPRQGTALLSGLLVCGKCHSRLTVHYQGEGKRHSYLCGRQKTDYGEEICQHFTGVNLDRLISEQVLKTLTPARLELSLAAAEQVEEERRQLHRVWEQRQERARYEAERAARQYQAVEPENRLVARQLEREWEEKLAAQKQLEEEYHRVISRQPRRLSVQEQDTIRHLAQDIPHLWADAKTTNAERKRILRQLIEHIEVQVRGDTEIVDIQVHWVGGVQTQGVCIRPVAKLEQLSYYERLCERARVLAGQGLKAGAIAAQLNAEGFKPPKRRQTFGRQGIRDLLQRLGLSRQISHTSQSLPRNQHEWELASLAWELGMPAVTLYRWLRLGWVRSRRTSQGRWLLWADESELERLRQLRQQPPGFNARRRWLEKKNELSGSAPEATSARA